MPARRPSRSSSRGNSCRWTFPTLGLPAEDLIAPELRDAAKRNILLRRPFSFADVTVGRERTTAELLYCVLGPASVRLTTLDSGDSLSIIGPLGNGFSVPQGKRLALLVVGGMGAPPIRCLAKLLRAEHPDTSIIAFVGAKTAKSLPFEGRFDEVPEQIDFLIPAFAEYGIPSAMTTDDGSAGRRGFITERLAQWLDEQRDWSPARNHHLRLRSGGDAGGRRTPRHSPEHRLPGQHGAADGLRHRPLPKLRRRVPRGRLQ